MRGATRALMGEGTEADKPCGSERLEHPRASCQSGFKNTHAFAVTLLEGDIER
jgi:hypothetical protein